MAQVNRRGFWMLLVFGVVAVMVVLGVMASVVTRFNRTLAARFDAVSEQQNELLCSLHAESQLQLQGLRAMAKRFGAEIPPLPGESKVTCHVGIDPVFIGTSGNDTLKGTDSPDWMNGEGGNDTIIAKGAGDSLIGDSGNDELVGGGGADYEYGGEGNDVLRSATADGDIDHLNGGPGKDTCYARDKDVVKECERVVRS